MEPMGGSNQRPSYNAWLAAKSTANGPTPRQLLSYQSCSNTGTCGDGTLGPANFTYANWVIDGTPVANRVMEWLTFRNNQNGELYYYATNCYPGGGSTGGCGSDPWVSVYAFGNNGDGQWVYPGSTARVGTKNPIWIPSMRLKMIRDGMQDYEYLLALTNVGQGTFVQQRITSWITNAYTFNNNGTAAGGSFTSDLTDARQALGTKLHQLTFPSVVASPTNLKGTVQ
jgi:hypothetical protein